MRSHTCESDMPSPEAGRRLLWASLVVAGGVLLSAWIGSFEISPFVGAGVLAASGLVGGLLLRSRARVPGLPLIAGTVIAASILVATLLGGYTEVTGGGVMFVALLVATTAPTRASGLASTTILAAALVFSALL